MAVVEIVDDGCNLSDHMPVVRLCCYIATRFDQRQK